MTGPVARELGARGGELSGPARRRPPAPRSTPRWPGGRAAAGAPRCQAASRPDRPGAPSGRPRSTGRAEARWRAGPRCRRLRRRRRGRRRRARRRTRRRAGRGRRPRPAPAPARRARRPGRRSRRRGGHGRRPPASASSRRAVNERTISSSRKRRPARPGDALHQGLVDELQEAVGGGHHIGAGHRARGRHVERAPERAEGQEDRPFVLAEQAERPVDRVGQRDLALRACRPGRAAETDQPASSCSRICAGENARTREAASSRASGMPSSRRQRATTAVEVVDGRPGPLGAVGEHADRGRRALLLEGRHLRRAGPAARPRAPARRRRRAPAGSWPAPGRRARHGRCGR